MIGGTDTIDTRNRGDDDGVRASEEGDSGGMTQAVDLIINGGVFFNIGVGRGDVGFGLVVVEVGDEIVHFVFREELAKLGVKLGGEGFVMGED